MLQHIFIRQALASLELQFAHKFQTVRIREFQELLQVQRRLIQNWRAGSRHHVGAQIGHERRVGQIVLAGMPQDVIDHHYHALPFGDRFPRHHCFVLRDFFIGVNRFVRLLVLRLLGRVFAMRAMLQPSLQIDRLILQRVRELVRHDGHLLFFRYPVHHVHRFVFQAVKPGHLLAQQPHHVGAEIEILRDEAELLQHHL